MTDTQGLKPSRKVNLELFSRLRLEDNNIRPLPGAVGARPAAAPDPRLSGLKPSVGLGPVSDQVCFYEHVATVRLTTRDPKFDQFFVAFRQTMDALFMEQNDMKLYPEYLMKSDVKKTELKTYIYMVKCLPRQVPILRSHEDWLSHITDETTFDTVAYFLLKNHVINEEMYGRIR